MDLSGGGPKPRPKPRQAPPLSPQRPRGKGHYLQALQAQCLLILSADHSLLRCKELPACITSSCNAKRNYSPLPCLRFYSLDIPSCFLTLTKCDLILYQVSKRESLVPRKVRKQVQHREAGGGCHLLPPPAGLLPLGVWSLTKEAPGSSLVPAPMGHSEKTQSVGQAVGPRRHQARWGQS